jgi:hypothetical protein
MVELAGRGRLLVVVDQPASVGALVIAVVPAWGIEVGSGVAGRGIRTALFGGVRLIAPFVRADRFATSSLICRLFVGIGQKVVIVWQIAN